MTSRSSRQHLKASHGEGYIIQPQIEHAKMQSSPKGGSVCRNLLPADGLKPDPSRTEALRNMPIPWNKEDVWCFLGFVANLAKYIPQLSEVNAPLRALLRAESIFDWQPAQDQAFQKLLDSCCQQPVLRYYDLKAPVEIHADACQIGLRGVLMQEGKPVAYS